MPGWLGRGERGISLLCWVYGRCGVGLPVTSHDRGTPALLHAEGHARSPALALWLRHPPRPFPLLSTTCAIAFWRR